jgi:Xaa-Pro aminopeptidase
VRQNVIERQQAAMEAAGLDALVAISPENFAYTTGFVIPSQPLMRWRHNAAVVTRSGSAALLAVDMEASTARSKAPGVDLRVWGEFTDRPMTVLASLLRDLGVASDRIGVEMDYLPARDFEELRVALPGVTWSAAEGVYNRLRQNKTAEEIGLLRRLSRLADQSIAEAFAHVRAGMTEMDIAGALTRAVYARGAEYFKLMIIATGERSEFPNVGPTDRVLKPGDLCRVEIFPVIGGYHAGVCRTAVVHEAAPQAKTIWRNLTECKHIVLDAIRPGASTRAIYQAFLKKFGELGLPPISFVGHGIGLHLHEEPYVGKYGNSCLEADMVLGIEPLVYGAGMGFGLQNKDMVAVTPTGVELLSDQTNTDELIVIR